MSSKKMECMSIKMMETKIVQSGYSRSKARYEVRVMTFEEALNPGGSIAVLDWKGMLRWVKVNGAVKTWKTRPQNCRIPFKYGMYEYGYIEYTDGKQTSGPEAVVIVRELTNGTDN